MVELNEKTQGDIEAGLVPLTRRICLSYVNEQYDPLGHLTPILMEPKLLLRELFGKEAGLGWDDPLQPEVAAQWSRYFKKAALIPKLVLPRRIRPKE